MARPADCSACHGQPVGDWYAEASRLARDERGFDWWAEMLAYRPDPDEPDDMTWED
jgi:hypothetical protein